MIGWMRGGVPLAIGGRGGGGDGMRGGDTPRREKEMGDTPEEQRSITQINNTKNRQTYTPSLSLTHTQTHTHTHTHKHTHTPFCQSSLSPRVSPGQKYQSLRLDYWLQ